MHFCRRSGQCPRQREIARVGIQKGKHIKSAGVRAKKKQIPFWFQWLFCSCKYCPHCLLLKWFYGRVFPYSVILLAVSFVQMHTTTNSNSYRKENPFSIYTHTNDYCTHLHNAFCSSVCIQRHTHIRRLLITRWNEWNTMKQNTTTVCVCPLLFSSLFTFFHYDFVLLLTIIIELKWKKKQVRHYCRNKWNEMTRKNKHFNRHFSAP